MHLSSSSRGPTSTLDLRETLMTSLWLDAAPPIGSDPVPAGQHFDVVVVGAGLTGLATALLLARAGKRVCVLEARRVGAVTTGNTTGKVSLLQGTQLSAILRNHSRGVGQAYVDGNREGQAWLLRYLRDHAIGYDVRDAYTYAGTQDGLASVRAEFEAATELGLDVEWQDGIEPTIPCAGAVRLADQAQIDPMPVLAALVADARQHGAVIVEQTRVTGVHRGRQTRVDIPTGSLTAESVVLASGVPFLDRGLYFAKVVPQRSYGMAFRAPGPLPQGMYLSADSPTRSLRTARHGVEELLVVGGNGHTVGRARSPKALVKELTTWTTAYFPGAERTHVWSAQDYSSLNGVPFVGAMPRTGGKVLVATGYSKWGMTNAVAAALNLSSTILGGRMDWAKTLGTRITKPPAVVSGAVANAEVGVELTKGWASAELHALSDTDRRPPEGAGVVGRDGVQPVGVSTVDGRTCAVSAVCTHLKGILTWNDQERSWDCPLHGSRFAADGTRLEGPATSDLARHGSDDGV